MQWQRVIHGFGAAIENAGRVHSTYEFTVPSVPGVLIMIRVVETPEGQYYALPSHCIDNDRCAERGHLPPAPTPERALQEALNDFLVRIQSVEAPRLARIQNW